MPFWVICLHVGGSEPWPLSIGNRDCFLVLIIIGNDTKDRQDSLNSLLWAVIGSSLA